MKSHAVIGTLLVVAAPLAAGAELESLLRIGLNNSTADLRWGLSQAEAQRLFGADTRPGEPDKSQWIQDIDVSFGQCRFLAHLHGNKKDDSLRRIRVLGTDGPAAECQAQVSQLITRLYAQRPLVTQTGWTSQPRDGAMHSGTLTSSSWETQNTCAGLSWSDGAGYPGANVSIILESTGCGQDGKNITAAAPDAATIPAVDANSPWESLLRVGMNAPDPAIRWDTPLAELQRRFSADVKNDAPQPPWKQLRLAVSDADCRYDATLGGRREGEFASIRMDQTAGSATVCRERMRAQLSRLYGPHSAETDQASWTLKRKNGEFLSGDVFAVSWDAKAACVTLTWYEGAGFTGARNGLQISSERGCGSELDGGLHNLNMIER